MIKKILEKIFGKKTIGKKIICDHTNKVSKTVKYCIDCKLVLDES